MYGGSQVAWAIPSRRRRCLILVALTALLTATLALAAGSVARAATCHVPEGTFTTCPGGAAEWSDVTPLNFGESDAHLYAAQADLTPSSGPSSPADRFELMYDECGRRTPLSANEYILVSFKTVEVENGVAALSNYAVHLFGDGTVVVLENGAAQRAGSGARRAALVDGQRGAVGFGTSPMCGFAHPTGEFEIHLAAAQGGVQPAQYGEEPPAGYSPDPIWWSGNTPFNGPIFSFDSDFDGISDDFDNCPGTPNADQLDLDFNGIGDACEAPLGQVLAAAGQLVSSHSTAAFLSAALDGTTAAEATPLPLSQEPSLLSQIQLIVEYRVAAGLTRDAAKLTRQLIHSQVVLGAIPANQEQALTTSITDRVTANAGTPIALLSAKADRKGTITLKTRVSGSGALLARARIKVGSGPYGKRRTVTYGTRRTTVLTKRLITLKIAPGKAALRQLRSHRVVRASIDVTFTPAGGKPHTKRKTIAIRFRR